MNGELEDDLEACQRHLENLRQLNHQVHILLVS
jgi:hypothetical protein